MSAETKAAVEKALEAHMADEHEMQTVLTGYILQAVGQSVHDDRDLLCYCGLTGQSGVVTQGLLAYIDYNATGLTFGDIDDDDE
jgi:hypothetical protein